MEYLKSRGLILSEATFPLWELFLLNMPRLSRLCRQFCQEQYAQKNPVRPPAVPLESIHWQPPLDIVERHLSILDEYEYLNIYI